MADADDARISDETLIGRVAAGDRSAFDRLVRRHQALVYRFAQAAAPAEEGEAEEILRETFLAARQGANRYRDEASARSWLLSLARRSIDRRRPCRDADSTSLRELVLVAAGQGGSGWEGTLRDARAVAAALAVLPAEDREILTLCDRESFSMEEAARVTGLANGALRTRLHRARLRLLAKLKE